MKHLLFLFAIFALITISCSDKSSTQVEEDDNLPLMPLSVGNYWIFKGSVYDSTNANDTAKSYLVNPFDTIRITETKSMLWTMPDSSKILLETFLTNKTCLMAYNNDTLYQGCVMDNKTLLVNKFHKHTANDRPNISTSLKQFVSCYHFKKDSGCYSDYNFKSGLGPVKLEIQSTHIKLQNIDLHTSKIVFNLTEYHIN